MLAVLAAALFLVGFGLVVEGPIRRVTYGLGLAIAVLVVVWGAWVYHLPIPFTPDNAITAAAQGSVLTSDGDYRGGVAAYDRAIAAHEDFATAYTGRARARLLAANPDYPVTRAFTDPGGSETAAAVRDAQRALDLGGHRDLLGEALLALVAFYRGDYDQAISGADAAIEINPDVPDVWLLKSAAQLALGDSDGADASLTTALGLLKGSDPSQRTRLLAASYLSYLAAVAHDKPEHADEARRFSARVVATETAFTLQRKLPTGGPPDRQRRGHRPEIRKRTTEPRHPLARSPSRHSAQRDRVRTAARKRGLDTATRPRALRHRPRDRHAPNQRATVANMQTNRRQGGHLSQRGAATLNGWPRRHADLLTGAVDEAT